jgi:hypothetical protein
VNQSSRNRVNNKVESSDTSWRRRTNLLLAQAFISLKEGEGISAFTNEDEMLLAILGKYPLSR